MTEALKVFWMVTAAVSTGNDVIRNQLAPIGFAAIDAGVSVTTQDKLSQREVTRNLAAFQAPFDLRDGARHPIGVYPKRRQNLGVIPHASPRSRSMRATVSGERLATSRATS